MITMGALTPHPPIIVPEVGGRETRNVTSTIEAMKRLSEIMWSKNPDTVVLITPHNLVFRDAVGILIDDILSGSLAPFGAPEVKFSLPNNMALVKTIQEECLMSNFPIAEIGEKFRYRYGMTQILDHASIVPLYYLLNGKELPLVILTMAFMPYERLFEFGKILQKALQRYEGNVVLVASGDLSHRLTPGAPAGYNPIGKVFDEKVVDVIRNFDSKGLLSIDKELIEEAGECGYRPLVMLFGAFDGIKVKTEVLSYEGPFGVGYCVAAIHPEREV